MLNRVADRICEFLEEKGITHVFLLSGGGMMHLQDALSRRDKLHTVCHHHEQSATFAAEAYARLSGKMGVVFATSGPGAANTVTGILQAWVDSTPLLVITGQAKLSDTLRGTDSFARQVGTFECDIVSIVSSITKLRLFLDHPPLLQSYLQEAYESATQGRPGPVLIDIPVDIQGAEWKA